MLLYITYQEKNNSQGCPTTLKVQSLFDEEGRDYTFLVGYDQVFCSMTEIREDIALKLSVDPDEIDLEEV